MNSKFIIVDDKNLKLIGLGNAYLDMFRANEEKKGASFSVTPEKETSIPIQTGVTQVNTPSEIVSPQELEIPVQVEASVMNETNNVFENPSQMDSQAVQIPSVNGPEEVAQPQLPNEEMVKDEPVVQIPSVNETVEMVQPQLPNEEIVKDEPAVQIPSVNEPVEVVQPQLPNEEIVKDEPVVQIPSVNETVEVTQPQLANEEEVKTESEIIKQEVGNPIEKSPIPEVPVMEEKIEELTQKTDEDIIDSAKQIQEKELSSWDEAINVIANALSELKTWEIENKKLRDLVDRLETANERLEYNNKAIREQLLLETARRENAEKVLNGALVRDQQQNK